MKTPRPHYTWELMAAPVPPVLIEGLVSRHGITGVSADSGVGKTFFALEMMRAVVTGTPFLGHFPTKRGGVLFVGQDCSLLEYARQMRKVTRVLYNEMEAAHAGDEEFQNPFDVYVRWFLHAGFSLENPDSVQAIIRAAKEVPHPEESAEPEPFFNEETGQWEEREYAPAAALIVLDVLSMMHNVRENANDEMLLVFRNIREIAEETGSAVIVLHHHSYANEYNQGGRWRGASSQLQTLDGHLELKRGKKPRLWCTTKKFRGIALEPFCYEMNATETDIAFKYLGTRDETPATADPFLDEVLNFVNSTDASFQAGEVTKHVLETLKPMMSHDTLRTRVSRMLTHLAEEGTLKKVAHGTYVRNKPEDPDANRAV